MRSVLLLVACLPLSVATLNCFSTELRTVQAVTHKSTVCLMELNLYNLGCLSPLVISLLNVETAYARTAIYDLKGQKGTAVCVEEGNQYLRCYCDWNECNRDWIRPLLSRWACELWPNGTKDAQPYYHYSLPVTNTATAEDPDSSHIAELVLLWLVGGGLLLLVIGIVIYAFTLGGGLNPTVGEKGTSARQTTTTGTTGTTATKATTVSTSGKPTTTASKKDQ